ncbi:hypothetical protein M9458_043995, partial [Cirrhinus mrigala]
SKQQTLRGKKQCEVGPTSPSSPDEVSQRSTDVTILEAINSLRSDLRATKVEICQTIDNRIEEMASTLRGEISALKSETQAAIQALQTMTAQHGSTLADLEQSVTHSSDAISKLQSEVKRLSSEVNTLTDKCMDLEGRSRRQNMRIVRLKEGTERGKEMNTFVSELLKEVLSMDEYPLVDRAHRALRMRPNDTDPPRSLIVRLHYFRDVTTILRKAADRRDLVYNGQKIRIFLDFTPEVAKRRAAFNRARELLCDKPGVRYGTLFPAKLRVIFNGTEKAEEFAELHFGTGRKDAE